MFTQWLPQETSPNQRYTAHFKAADLWATTFDLIVDDHETETTVTILEDAAEMTRGPMPPHYQLSWSPDSEWVAFSRMFMGRPENYLVIFKPTGSRIFHSNRSTWFLDWSNDSQYLVLLEFIATGEPQIDVWSSEAEDMFTTYPFATEKYIDSIVWSPTANIFAFLESNRDRNLPIDSSLNIVSVETGIRTVFPLQSDLRLILDYDPELLWSPDSEYIALSYGYLDQILRVQIFPANGADPMDVAEGEEKIQFTWTGNGDLLYWTMDEYYKADLNSFNPISQQSTFIRDHYLSHFIFQNSILIEWYDEEGFNVELVDFSGNERSPILTDVEQLTSYFSHNPSGYFFYLWEDENSEVWVTQVTPDEFQVRTYPLNISFSQHYWFYDSNLLAYSGYAGEESQAGIIDVLSGRPILSLYQGLHVLQVIPYFLPLDQIGFISSDDNGNTWFDIYRSDGTHLYRLHAGGLIDSYAPSPNEEVWAITTNLATMSSNITLYSLRLSRPDEPNSDLIRSDLSEISYLTWSPDGDRLAFASADQAGVRRIEVVTKDGEDVQEFVGVWVPQYGDLEWAHCDSLQ
jgi:Tol biopolymer transport system component